MPVGACRFLRGPAPGLRGPTQCAAGASGPNVKAHNPSLGGSHGTTHNIDHPGGSTRRRTGDDRDHPRSAVRRSGGSTYLVGGHGGRRPGCDQRLEHHRGPHDRYRERDAGPRVTAVLRFRPPRDVQRRGRDRGRVRVLRATWAASIRRRSGRGRRRRSPRRRLHTERSSTISRRRPTTCAPTTWHTWRTQPKGAGTALGKVVGDAAARDLIRDRRNDGRGARGQLRPASSAGCVAADPAGPGADGGAVAGLRPAAAARLADADPASRSGPAHQCGVCGRRRGGAGIRISRTIGPDAGSDRDRAVLQRQPGRAVPVGDARRGQRPWPGHRRQRTHVRHPQQLDGRRIDRGLALEVRRGVLAADHGDPRGGQ